MVRRPVELHQRRMRVTLLLLAVSGAVLGVGTTAPPALAGAISTVAGRGSEDAPFGDGGPATGAAFYPAYVALTRAGGYLISDTANNQVREVLANGTIRTVAGNGRGSFSGDGGPATAAGLGAPGGVAPTPDGGFLVADTANQRVRQVSATGAITTVAGTGRRGSSGDGGAATRARLH